MSEEKAVLISCGIIKNEIKYLVAKNKWNLDLEFLDSSLHVDFNKLHKALFTKLEKHKGKQIFVFYGVCHPLINELLKKYKAIRTPVQNCVEILLGKEKFTHNLSNGSFFLIEDWAKRWDIVTGLSLGANEKHIQMVFESEHKNLFCINTNCSKDFTKEAEKISKSLNLPLKWENIDLNNLEKVLTNTLKKVIS